MSRHALALARVWAVLCVAFLCGRDNAQEYYGVPIEDGGVAFLLDVSGSMAERTPLRVPAGTVKPDEAWRSGTGQTNSRRTVPSAPQISKMESARRELLHALSSLRDRPHFTIITVGNAAGECPRGARTMGPASISRVRYNAANMPAP